MTWPLLYCFVIERGKYAKTSLSGRRTSNGVALLDMIAPQLFPCSRDIGEILLYAAGLALSAAIAVSTLLTPDTP